MADPGYDEHGMMDKDASPRLNFRVENGELQVQRVHWYERPGRDDVHVEGRSHWVYGNWQTIRAIELYDDVPEVVLDHLLSMLPEDLRR